MILIKLKYRLAKLYRSFLFFIGLEKAILKNRYGERILVFHGVDSKGNTQYNSRFVSKDYLEDFIKYISVHFNVISLNDFYSKKFKANTLNIAITFDDGYLNNYSYAIPILKKYNIPASFFITTIHNLNNFLWTDFLDLVSFHTPKTEIIFKDKVYKKNTKSEFVYNGTSLKNKCKALGYSEIATLHELFQEEWKEIADKTKEYWQLMDIDKLKDIANDPLFSLGTHGKTHANLEIMDSEEVEGELKESKEFLEALCNRPVQDFAFPFGYYNKKLIELCKEIGYKKILLVDYNDNLDKNDISTQNRFVINPYIPMKHQIACLLKGTYL